MHPAPAGVKPFVPLSLSGDTAFSVFRPLFMAVQQAEDHERQFNDKFQDKSKQRREHNHGQFENSEVDPGLGDHIPVLNYAILHSRDRVRYKVLGFRYKVKGVRFKVLISQQRAVELILKILPAGIILLPSDFW